VKVYSNQYLKRVSFR